MDAQAKTIDEGNVADQENEQRERTWQLQFNKWISDGMPLESVPGKHPNDDHKWNIDKESCLKDLKIDGLS